MKKQTPAARCQYHTLKPDAPTLAGTLAKLLPSIAAAFLLPWDITEGCSHTCYQQVSAERIPCTQSCQQVSRSNLHLLRGLDERPTPSWAFFGQAISALLSSSPTSSATPSWVNTLHLPSSLPPFLLPSRRNTLLTLTPPRSLCSNMSPTFTPLHLQDWLHCPPSPSLRSL